MLDLIDHVPSTLVAFHFDEKLAQNVAPMTKQHQMSKELLSLHFAVDHMFQFQNMIWKTEECRVNKKIELNIRR